MGTPVFFLEPTERYRLALRRYASRDEPCPNGCSYHQAMAPIGEGQGEEVTNGDRHPHDDPRWPAQCEGCDYRFVDGDVWQLFTDRIYRRADTGEETTLRSAPVGACWNAAWLADLDSPWYHGPDGRCLYVRTPGGDWCPDHRASNCTLPDDSDHKCWVRHGRPEDGTLHVDKEGVTCAAGAGSIGHEDQWHGFLHHGQLVRMLMHIRQRGPSDCGVAAVAMFTGQDPMKDVR
jgi:hypothetical protein